MYGPVDGAGVVDWSFAGVEAGTGAANSVARMLEKSPCGAVRLIVILPVELSTTIPLMWPVFVLEYWLAPTMLLKKPTPGESILKSRSIVAWKSLALTAVPSEYLRPLRAVRPVHVLVAEQRQVDVPHDAPTLDRVRKAGVEVVGAGVRRDLEGREALAGSRTTRCRR